MNETAEMPTEYRCLLSKLEELLRYYKVAKKNDKNNALQERVKNKSNEIIAKLQLFPIFEEIEKECRYKMELAFREVKPQTTPAPRANPNPPSKAKTIEPPKRGFGSSSMSSYSSQSSQSNQSNPVVSSAKKEVSIIEERPKITPTIVQKPIVEPPPAPLKVIKQEVKIQQQLPRPIITLKPDLMNESMSSSKSSIESNDKKEGSSISSIENAKFVEKDNKSQQRSFLGLLDQNESEDNFRLQKQKSEGKVQTPSGSLSFENQKEEDSEKFSQTSQAENTIDTIVKFCCDNKQKLNTELVFNEDIFDYIREQEGGEFIYLIGVNKPQGKKMQKLYACTLMKFSIAQVMKCDDLFEKETKDFKNNIRTPIGLILKGAGPAAIQPQHIKFLINLQCPYMVILVLKDYQQYDGVLCHFHESVLGRIRITPRKQLGQCAEELAKKTFTLPFGESYLPKEKTRYVITKSLVRTVVTSAQEAPNAITISDNDCIREEKNSFNYKLHSKFLVSTKPQFSIYYVNNSVVNARIGFKDFEQFKKQALSLQPKVPAIFSINVARDNVVVKKEFFDVLLQCNKIRDPNIFLNLSNISVKKTIVVALKSDVTQEMLDTMTAKPLQYKAFQKDTPFTFCLLSIGKNNAKEFQAEGKNELIQIKSK